MLPQRLNGPIIKLDLLNPSHLEHVKSLICNPACVYVHFAPPCGTASRARLIQNQQHTLPPPLRDDQHPNGLPWLTLEQQIRVDKANQLYQITCNLIQLCEQHHILWSCENPGRSFMWQTTSFVKLFAMYVYRVSPLHVWIFETKAHQIDSLTISHRFTNCIICVIINTNTSPGAKDPMGRGQLQKKRHTLGRWHEPLLLKC